MDACGRVCVCVCGVCCFFFDHIDWMWFLKIKYGFASLMIMKLWNEAKGTCQTADMIWLLSMSEEPLYLVNHQVLQFSVTGTWHQHGQISTLETKNLSLLWENVVFWAYTHFKKTNVFSH